MSDNIMLPEMDKALRQDPQRDLVLVLHTLSNHGPTYYERYTNEFRRFTPLAIPMKLIVAVKNNW